MDFYSAYDQGFARVAVCTVPLVRPGDDLVWHTIELAGETVHSGLT